MEIGIAALEISVGEKEEDCPRLYMSSGHL
jgi:hypothetical protein